MHTTVCHTHRINLEQVSGDSNWSDPEDDVIITNRQRYVQIYANVCVCQFPRISKGVNPRGTRRRVA